MIWGQQLRALDIEGFMIDIVQLLVRFPGNKKPNIYNICQVLQK